MKSNWLRNYLNPYFDKVKKIYKEMQNTSKKMEFYLKLRSLVLNFYGSNNFKSNSYSISLQPSQFGIMSSLDLLKIKNNIDSIEYNKIIYQRFQRIILSIKENLSLNGDFKSRSKKLGKNIRAFIKRDYKSNGLLETQQNNPTQNQNYSFWSQFFKNTILKINNYTSYGYNEFSHSNNLLNLSKTNLFWALNKINVSGASSGSIQNLYSYPKKIWQTYKIREISKSNKTKKLIFNVLTKYGIPLSGISSTENNLKPLDDFNEILNKKTFSSPTAWTDQVLPVNVKLTSCRVAGDPAASASFPAAGPILLQQQNRHKEDLRGPSVFNSKFSSNDLKEGLSNSIIPQFSENASWFTPLKTYTIKSERKLKTIENKLKLLGLYSKKLEKTYKTNYLRSLKQQLYLNSVNLPIKLSLQYSKQYNAKSTNAANSFSNLNHYTKISNNYFYWWSFLKMTTNFNEYSIETKLYKNSLLENRLIDFKTQNITKNQDIIFSLLFHFSALVSFISLGGVRTLMKFYYILVSKISKLLSQISFIQFFKPIFLQQENRHPAAWNESEAVYTGSHLKGSHTFGHVNSTMQSANSIGQRFFSNYTKFYQIEGLTYFEKNNTTDYMALDPTSSITREHPTQGNLLNFKINKENQNVEKMQKQIFFNTLATRSHLFFLKYLLTPASTSFLSGPLCASFPAPGKEVLEQEKRERKEAPAWSVPTMQVLECSRNKNTFDYTAVNNFSGSWRFLNKRNNKFSEKQVDNKIMSEFSNSSKNKVNNHLKYLYFSSKIFSINRLLRKEIPKNEKLSLLNKYKTKTIYFTISKISNIFYGFYKTSFYIKFLLLKSIDLFSVPISFIYKFFEKPGEYVVDNLAYNFLLEWSADLITTIPDTIDVSTYSYFYKINRTITPTLLLYNLLPIFLSGQQLYQSGGFSSDHLKITGHFPSNKVEMNMLSGTTNRSTFPSVSENSFGLIQNNTLQEKMFNYFLEKNNYVTPFLFAISNNILKRLLNSTLLIFIQQLSEPDLDYINRQKKGIIFWDVWGEYLKQVAEENSINIYELTTDKEEQIKLLSKYEEILIGQSNNLSNINEISSKGFHFTWLKIFERASSMVPGNHADRQNRNKYLNNKKQINYGSSLKKKNLLNYSDTKIEQNLLENDWPKEYITPFLLFKKSQSLDKINPWSTPMQGLFSKLGKNRRSSIIQKVHSNEKNSNSHRSVKFSKKNSRNSLNFDVGWSVSQFLSYQGKDTDLFIDLHPPKSFWSIPSLKYSYTVQQPIGSIVCQIFAGIFYKQISKNILVIGSAGLEKSLLIQAMAGETELKIITDNANRYAMVYRGVAVGIKLLKDVFEALSVHTPCIFLMEDIHAIGERRPFLIDDNSGTDDTSYNKNQSMQGLLLKEKSSGSEGSREALYKSSKHLLSQYKKPYKEPKSLATNHFSFTFLFSDSLNKKQIKIRNNDFKPGSAALPIQVIKKENEFKYKIPSKNFTNKTSNKTNSFDSTDPLQLFSQNLSILNHESSHAGDSESSNNSSLINNKYSSAFEIKTNNSQLLAPPASSPFSVLILKEEKKLKHKKLVKEMPWFGLPGEQFSIVSKYNYSIRIKVALLADIVLSNLSVKLDMITDLLIIIDSVKGNRGFVVFATTHIPSILDPALRRPGRFDETINLSLNSTLVSRWVNYRYNFKYLSTYLKGSQLSTANTIGSFTSFPAAGKEAPWSVHSLERPHKSNDHNLIKKPFGSVFHQMLNQVPLNSTYNKGITLDLFNSSLNFQGLLNNYQENNFISHQGSNELINYIYKKSSIPTQLLTNCSLCLFPLSSSFPAAGPILLQQEKRRKAGWMVGSDHAAGEERGSKNTYYNKIKKGEFLKSSLAQIIDNFKNKSSTKKINFKISKSSNISNLSGQVHSTMQLKEDSTLNQQIVSKRLNNKISNISNKRLLNLKTKNYTLACKSLMSLLLFTSLSSKNYSSHNKTCSTSSSDMEFSHGTDHTGLSSDLKVRGLYPKGKVAPLKWLSMLKDSNNLLNDYSIYVTLFGQPLILKVILINLIGGKMGENLVNNNFLFNFDEIWKQASSLLLNYLQKRQFSIGMTSAQENSTQQGDPFFRKSSNLLNYSKGIYKLLSFNNRYSLMEPPSPPISNILLPSKRYENYKKTFRNEYETLNKQNSFSGSILEKLKFHEQQRLLKRLYKYPIKEFFKSEILTSYTDKKTSDYTINSDPTVLTNFNTSYLTLAPLEKTSSRLTKLTKISSINWSYKNILYNRHKTYLTNQWWNGQQGEHNAETTFLSDIDWRFTFVQSIGDINIDFPDSEQFYNPRNRRWVLTKGDWNYWFNIESEFKDIYYHYIYDCFISAYKYLNKNREIIDFYAERLHQQPTSQVLGSPTNKYLSSFLNERELLNIYKRFSNN